MTKEFLNFLQYEKRYSRHTLISYQNDLNQLQSFLSNEYPDSSIKDVNHAILREWIVSLSECGLSEKSINRKMVTLRSFYKFLLKKGMIGFSPVTKLSNLKTSKNLPQFVREQDILAVLDKGSTEGNFMEKRDILVMELFYGTGIRLSELIELRESNVDHFQKSIKVLGKRNKERVIPITQELLNQLGKYILLKNDTFSGNASDYLIVSNKGSKSYPMMIQRIVKKYLQHSAVDKKNPHILRHTYATHLLERGADLNAVKELLGHQSLAATQVYTHNSLGKIKKVFDQAHPKA